MNIGIIANYGYKLKITERAKMIGDAGYTSVFLYWSDVNEEEIPNTAQPELFRKHGLEITSVHAPFDNINDIWVDNQNGQSLYEILASCVSDCGEHNIPVAVMHIAKGNNPPKPCDIGFDRLRRLLDLGEKYNVDLAFENTRTLAYLDLLFASFESSRLKFCYDIGHEYCLDRVMRLIGLCKKSNIDFSFKNIQTPEYFEGLLSQVGISLINFQNDDYPKIDLLNIYGDRIVAIHLHDNDGTGDLHLMPFDGSIPWYDTIKRLKNTGFNGDLMLECIATESDLIKYSSEEYLAESMKRAKMLEKLFSI